MSPEHSVTGKNLLTRERQLPVWRTLLYVPVNVERFVEKAHLRGADCIELDLENSVPDSEKAYARSLAQTAAKQVSRGGADVVVRINRPLRTTILDLEAVVSQQVAGVAIAKVENAAHIRLLDEVVTELEAERDLPPGHTKFIAMVETPEAFFQMPEIAKSSPRIVGLDIGGEDFASNTGMESADDTMLYPKQQLIFAARAAGVMPIGFIGSIANLGDWDVFRAMVQRSRRFGFMGASCIHPAQVTIVNEEYRPRPEEVAYAQRVIDENEKAAAEGRGSFAIDGNMIDTPIVARAIETLTRDASVREREEKHRQAALSGET